MLAPKPPSSRKGKRRSNFKLRRFLSPKDLEFLKSLLPSLPLAQCDGCDGCGLRCTEGVAMTLHEFECLRAFLLRLPPDEVRRVLGQDKQVRVGGEWVYKACPFRDGERGLCLVYPARPLVCRLFGIVEFWPCPLQKIKQRVENAAEIIAWYTQFERRTYEGWVEALGPSAPLSLGQPLPSPLPAPARG